MSPFFFCTYTKQMNKSVLCFLSNNEYQRKKYIFKWKLHTQHNVCICLTSVKFNIYIWFVHLTIQLKCARLNRTFIIKSCFSIKIIVVFELQTHTYIESFILTINKHWQKLIPVSNMTVIVCEILLRGKARHKVR